MNGKNAIINITHSDSTNIHIIIILRLCGNPVYCIDVILGMIVKKMPTNRLMNTKRYRKICAQISIRSWRVSLNQPER